MAAVGEGPCENANTVNSFVGDKFNPPAGGFTNVRGIRSQIFDQQDLDFCTASFDPGHGSNYWVALVPAPGNPHYNDPEAILQVGVIKCQNPLYAVCTGTPQYFWAAGGCGYAPTAQPFGGTAPVGGITFAVRHIGASTYWLTADPLSSGYPTQQGWTGDDNLALCWAFGAGRPVAAQIMCERWDNGDNCGGIGGSNPIDFQTIRFQVSVDGQWYIPGNAGSPLGPVTCAPYHVELHCIDNGDDRFSTYAVQQ